MNYTMNQLKLELFIFVNSAIIYWQSFSRRNAGGLAIMKSNELALEAVCSAVRIILENGGEIYRAEETAEYMCAGFHLDDAQVFAMPTGVVMTVQSEGDTCTRLVRVHSRGINLEKLNRCNGISREVAGGAMNAEQALKELRNIESAAGWKLWVMILACAFSSAFFCVMFNGGIKEFLVTFACGAICQICMCIYSKHRVPTLLSAMSMGFLSALGVLFCSLFIPDLKTEPAISGALMPFVSGLAMTTAIRDTIKGDLVSGGARLIEAFMTAVMLAVGAGIMLRMWAGNVQSNAEEIHVVWRLTGCFLASMAFCFLLNQPVKTIPLSGLLGTAGYAIFMVLNQGMIAYFVAGLLISVSCEIMARCMKCTATMLITSCLIPLVPGLGLYRTMLWITQSSYRKGAETGVDALLGILAIAMSVTITMLIFDGINKVKNKKNAVQGGKIH